MSALADKLRRAREEIVEVGGFAFTVRRPTDIEMMELRGASGNAARRLLPFVVGWSGVREVDLIPGGDPHPLDFDADACAEWLSDRPDLLDPLAARLMERYKEHAQALVDAAKK